MRIIKRFIIAILLAIFIGYSNPIGATVKQGNLLKGVCFQDAICCAKTVNLNNDDRVLVITLILERSGNILHSSTCKLLQDTTIKELHEGFNAFGVNQIETLTFALMGEYVICDVCNCEFIKCTTKNKAVCCKWFKYIIEKHEPVLGDEVKNFTILHLTTCKKLINKKNKLYSNLELECMYCFSSDYLMSEYLPCNYCLLPVGIDKNVPKRVICPKGNLITRV